VYLLNNIAFIRSENQGSLTETINNKMESVFLVKTMIKKQIIKGKVQKRLKNLKDKSHSSQGTASICPSQRLNLYSETIYLAIISLVAILQLLPNQFFFSKTTLLYLLEMDQAIQQ